MAGRYEPGQKLKLRDLAERLGTSVTPVREALARLVSDQVLVQIDHRSVCVAVLDLDGFDEVRALRLELEGKGAALRPPARRQPISRNCSRFMRGCSMHGGVTAIRTSCRERAVSPHLVPQRADAGSASVG